MSHIQFVKFDHAVLIFRVHSVAMSGARYRPEEVFFGELDSSDEEVEDSFDCDEILSMNVTWEEDK